MCYPKEAHSLGHRGGQLLTSGSFVIQFKIFIMLHQGGSFIYSPLAAITHFLGILDSVRNAGGISGHTKLRYEKSYLIH